jgi:hypothetical protein
MDDRCDLADQLEATALRAVTALRLVVPGRDWLDEILDTDGDLIRSDQAAYIAGVSADTVGRRAEAAALAGKPIGALMANIWLISLRRWLDAIEDKDGRPARLAAQSRVAQSRVDKNADLRLLPQKSAGLR